MGKMSEIDIDEQEAWINSEDEYIKEEELKKAMNKKYKEGLCQHLLTQ